MLSVLFVLITQPAFGQAGVTDRATIVSPTHPTDSRGETVYQTQKPTEPQQPVVPGKLVQSSVIKMPPAKCCKALRNTHLDIEVPIEGVIAEKGDFIDPTVVGKINPELTKCALDEVARYRFRPATLDGKVVAVPAKVVIHFQTY